MKTTAQAMQYEESGTKGIKDPHAVLRKAYKHQVNTQSTMYTLWLLVVKHKVALLAAGNVVLVLNWVFPAWFDLVLSLIGK